MSWNAVVVALGVTVIGIGCTGKSPRSSDDDAGPPRGGAKVADPRHSVDTVPRRNESQPTKMVTDLTPLPNLRWSAHTSIPRCLEVSTGELWRENGVVFGRLNVNVRRSIGSCGCTSFLISYRAFVSPAPEPSEALRTRELSKRGPKRGWQRPAQSEEESDEALREEQEGEDGRLHAVFPIENKTGLVSRALPLLLDPESVDGARLGVRVGCADHV